MITIKRLVLDEYELTEKQPRLFKKKKKKLTEKKNITKPVKKVNF